MKKKFVILSIWFALVSFTAFAQLKMPEIFSDHMVLQRAEAVAVWGTGAGAGKMVTVELGKKMGRTIADSTGAWKAELPAMLAGGPYELWVRSGADTVTFTDVLIGEVWVASGQSNMAWPLQSSAGYKDEQADLSHPQIRLFRMEPGVHLRPEPYTSEEVAKITSGHFYKSASWQLCDAQTAPPFSAVAYYLGAMLRDSLNVPVGLIQNAVGGSPTQAWISRQALQARPDLKKYVPDSEKSDWFSVKELHPFISERVKQNLGSALDDGVASAWQHPFSPAYLYDHGLAPLIPFGIRGVIWYQGESNANYPREHQRLFETLIQSWRKDWGQGNFPFLYVQLPAIGDRNRWPEFREGQKETLDLPNTGMAVTIDLGDKENPDNVHPPVKSPVGERLGRIALAKVYDFNLEYSGPVVSDYQFKDQNLSITFSHAGKLTTSDGENLKGLVLQGYGKHGTEEEIVDANDVEMNGNRLIISVPKGFSVTKAKYAWAPFPECNLVNEERLPASPFRIELPGNF